MAMFRDSRSGRPGRRVKAAVAVASVVVALGVTAGCGSESGDQGPGDGGETELPRRSPVSAEGRIDSGVLFFVNDERMAFPGLFVARTRAEVTALTQWFAVATPGSTSLFDEATEALAGADLKRNVLVAQTTTTGCSQAGGAELTESGGRLGMTLVDHPEPPPECYAPYQATAVFEVPRERLPDRPVFGEEKVPATSAAPARKLAFVPVEVAGPAPAEQEDVTTPARLDRYLGGLSEESAGRVRRALDRSKVSDRERRVAYTLVGCELRDAEMVLGSVPLTVRQVGGENVKCIRAMTYVAVFAVAEQLATDPAD